MASTDCSGKVALVTGASSGIGLATARVFAAAGAKVVLADIGDEAGEAAAAAIRDAGGEAVYVHADVSRAKDAARLVETAVASFGGLDYAFNNAGVEGTQQSVAEGEEAELERVLGVNLKGVWLCMRAEIPALLERGGGAIVNNASVAGLVGFANMSAYTASKHGVVGLTKSAALEVAQSGIRVNAVCPGVIETPMVTRALAESPELGPALAAAEPIGRFGQPEEIAGAVLWLCSDAASFVIGQAIAVDGGYVAQ